MTTKTAQFDTLYSAGRIFPDFLHDFLSPFWPNKNGGNKNGKKNGTHDR